MRINADEAENLLSDEGDVHMIHELHATCQQVSIGLTMIWFNRTNVLYSIPKEEHISLRYTIKK